MAQKWMDVYLLGEPQAGVARADLIGELAIAFNKDKSAIEKMLGAQRYLIKQGVDESLAEKYRVIIEKAGGRCELVMHTTELSHDHSTTAEGDAAGADLGATDVDNPAAVAPQPVAAQESRQCHKCGFALADPTVVNCPRCYARQVQRVAKNKTLAGFLALFLGGFGIHRFYLGQWWGLFYVVFWFTLIPWLIAIVEAIVFWSSSASRWQKKYGQVARSGVLMAVICVGSFFISTPVIGIFAAIALPAYQDYTNRVKVSSAMPLVNDARKKVAAHFAATGAFPSSNLEVGLPENISTGHVASLIVAQAGEIRVTFNFPNVHASDNTMIWSPAEAADGLVWSCTGGTLADRLRNHECRGGSGARTTGSTVAQPALNKRIFSDDRRLSVNVPSSWRENKSLNSEASLGAAHLLQESYIIVIAEPRADFDEDFTLSDYTEVILSMMTGAIDNSEVQGEVRHFKINGLPAEQVVLTGRVNRLGVTYLVTTVESNRGFYQVLSWTLSSRYKEKQKQMRAIARTFVVRTDPAY